MISELEEKTARLQRVLKAEQLGGVLINAQHNFAWLTGGRSNGIDLTRENGACFLFVTNDGKRYVISNNIELPRLLREEISANDFEPIEISWQREKDVSNVVGLAASLIEGGTIATDILFPAEHRVIEGLVAGCRHELTPAELERYGTLGRDAGLTVGTVVTKIAPGKTENDIARTLRDELVAGGMFPVVTLVGADERISKFRHPVPTDAIWRKSLLIAVCVRRHGLIVSLSRMICVGEIPAELQRRTEAAAAVNAALCSSTTADTSGIDLYGVAARAYADHGFPDEIYKHHQGGACGYRTRDWVAHPTCGEKVKLNQAFAWNPSITGTKTEETGIVTENGFETITSTRDFPQISSVVGGHEYLSPGILSLSKGASA